MKIVSTHKLSTIKNGLPFLGEVKLEIELLSDLKEHEVNEKYNGQGFHSQGSTESIPVNGYDSWKKGVIIGVDYALSMIVDDRKYRITILECKGLSTDTNPIILSFVSSRAILKELKNLETKTQLDKFEKIVFNSWNSDFENLIDFTKLIITTD